MGCKGDSNGIFLKNGISQLKFHYSSRLLIVIINNALRISER